MCLDTVIDMLTVQKQGDKSEREYVKAADNEGNTALHLAVQNGCEKVHQSSFKFLFSVLLFFKENFSMTLYFLMVLYFIVPICIL